MKARHQLPVPADLLLQDMAVHILLLHIMGHHPPPISPDLLLQGIENISKNHAFAGYEWNSIVIVFRSYFPALTYKRSCIKHE